MIGETISHYRILVRLGAGGMGEVYRAQDTKLDRDIAIKVLPPELALDPERLERFEREAKAVAALTHPNIVTIHSVEEDGGVHFITMELVEGETLAELLTPSGISLDRFFDLAIPLVDAVNSAHSKGVVHRDLKPANIMIDQEGRLKVLDFGLAKLLAPDLDSGVPEESATVDLTSSPTVAGRILGTADYMSPEQAEGKPVDHRSDFFSLGVILYEMVTGQRPFHGDSPASKISSLLRDTPVPVTDLRPALPNHLGRIIARCLDKRAERRYQSALDLKNDLEGLKRETETTQLSEGSGKSSGLHATQRGSKRFWFAGVAVVAVAAIALGYWQLRLGTESPVAGGDPTRKMLVVLPFENLGPAEEEYFSDGITDAITARLARFKGLGVISRQSAIQYKGTDKTIRQIGDELGVDYILEGTIQRERPGDPTSRIRIIPQLIRVSEDIHLWADSYDEDMTEVFRVQSDIAERVAHALNVALLETEREAIETAPTRNLAAYEYYLRGNEYFDRRYSSDVTMKAVAMYERATELDPKFSAAWAKLSQMYIWKFYSRISSMPDGKAVAKTALDRACELDPGSAEVEIALGYYYYYGEHDFDRALEHFERVRNIDLSNVDALNAIAFIKRRQSKWEESAALLENAADLNPRSFDSVLELGITCVTMRRYDKAARLLDRAIFLSPQDYMGHVFKILLHLLGEGDEEKAREALREASEFGKPARLGFDLAPFVHTRILAKAYSEIMSRVPPEDYGVEDSIQFDFGLAEMYYQLGRKKQAREIWHRASLSLKSETSPLFQQDIELGLGLAYAGLGRNEEALRLAHGVVAEAPMSTDAFLGTFRLHIAALIFVRTGAYEEAIDQLELLLSVPSETSRALFRRDPAWDPLRDNPRFQKLVEGEP